MAAVTAADPSARAGAGEGVEMTLAEERTAICYALGCVDKPGVPLRFLENLKRELSEQIARTGDAIRMWEPATPTERQELDRFRRGWGPSSPTERMKRREDVLTAWRALSSAMTTLSVSEEDAESGKVPSEAMDYLDEACTQISKVYDALNAVRQQIQDDPAEWPDIRAAEERGAAEALAKLTADVEGVVGGRCLDITGEITLDRGGVEVRTLLSDDDRRFAAAAWNASASRSPTAGGVAPEGYVLVPVEPTQEMLESFARLLCQAKGIEPDDPAPPHGDAPTWFYQCGAIAEAWEAALAAPTHRVEAGAVAGDLGGVEAALDRMLLTTWDEGAGICSAGSTKAAREAVLDAVRALVIPAGDAAKLVDDLEQANFDEGQVYERDGDISPAKFAAEDKVMAARSRLDAHLAAKDRELDALRRSGAAGDGVREAVPAELRRLSEEATAGEWRVETNTTMVWGDCSVDDDGYVERMGVPVVDARQARGWSKDGQPDYERAQYNAALSAAAVNDLRSRISAEDRAQGAQGREDR